MDFFLRHLVSLEALKLTNSLFDLIFHSEAMSILQGDNRRLVIDEESGTPLLIAGYFLNYNRPVTVVVSNLNSAEKIASSLASLVGEEKVMLFPFDEMLRLEAISTSKDLLGERLFVMANAVNNTNKILIVTAASAILPLPLPSLFKNSIQKIRCGETVVLEQLKLSLVKMGYEQVNKIDQSLQFASRGDILDIFPISQDKPIRIEFFGDEVDSIRYFDIASQTSIENLLEVDIIPANEFLFSEAELTNLKDKISQYNTREEDECFSNIFAYKYSPSTIRYYVSLKSATCSILDYFDANIIFVPDVEKCLDFDKKIRDDSKKYLDDLYSEGKLAFKSDIYLKSPPYYKDSKRIIYGHRYKETQEDVLFETRAIISPSINSLVRLNELVLSYINVSDKVVFAITNKIQYDTLLSILDEQKVDYEQVDGLNLPPKHVGLTLHPLFIGFELIKEKITYISSLELFNFHQRASKFLSHFKEATILKSYEELTPGDYIVHEFNGIGQFEDIVTMEIDGINRDFLHILYAKGEYLYVPLEQFRLVRKYAGKEGVAPKLSSLNSDSWEKTKKRIKSRISDMADKLYDLYKLRNQEKGFAFPKDDELQSLFESEFPYELTPDQQVSIKEIKEDLESEHVMDRLLCGDVGFGKTEIAFRAAFKVISSGKQVALLCPTIILARQHYLRAIERFYNYGVKVVLLSRMVSNKEQNKIFKDIKSGAAHLIIATHRLLSDKIEFNDLGLLIIDEEQRFGVQQKEKLKMLKNNVDVLSLSATPIPRTLQLSLVGLREISQINTPPLNRMPIQTYVLPYRFDVVVDLIKREKARAGQTFYVRNDIDALYYQTRILSNALPAINFAVIHGQMEKEEIENVISEFYAGKIDVLMATSIIENGIDIPNVNLLIVEDADHYGLSQLYQIKGRVGRGTRIAYAYFMFNAQKRMTNQAAKRLKAIQDFNELGSGYKIAQRDLLIRGAGDILGEEQAGFIDTIGMDLYIKLLNEVIEEKTTGKVKEPPTINSMFSLNAYIPQDYASKEDKIEIYQEIEECDSIAALQSIRKRLRDIYGKLPDEVDLLLRKRRIDIVGFAEPFTSILDKVSYIEIKYTRAFAYRDKIGMILFEALQPYLKIIKVYYVKNVLMIRLEKTGDWLKNLESIIEISLKISKTPVNAHSQK